MTLSAEARAQLAAQQAAMVSALMARGEPPANVDVVRFTAASESLARKRARMAARAWPGLSQVLGQRFDGLFFAYTETKTLPRKGGPLADGRAFALWLATRGELPDAGRLQALVVDLRYRSKPEGLLPRKWPTCQLACLPQSRRLIVAVRLLRLGEYSLNIPLGRRLK